MDLHQKAVQIAEIIKKHGRTTAGLDDLVHDAASAIASDTNNAGIEHQVEFLLANGSLSPSSILMALDIYENRCPECRFPYGRHAESCSRVSASEPDIDFFRKNEVLSVELVREGIKGGYRVIAEKMGDPSIYDELGISILREESAECVGYLHVLLDEDRNPKVLMTVEAEGDGDPHLAYYPLCPLELAIENC